MGFQTVLFGIFWILVANSFRVYNQSTNHNVTSFSHSFDRLCRQNWNIILTSSARSFFEIELAFINYAYFNKKYRYYASSFYSVLFGEISRTNKQMENTTNFPCPIIINIIIIVYFAFFFDIKYIFYMV